MPLDYAKWDALGSSDEDEGAARKTVTRKQAVRATPDEELQALADEFRRAEEEGQRLDQQLRLLQQQLSESGPEEPAAEASGRAGIDAEAAAGGAGAQWSPAGEEDVGSQGATPRRHKEGTESPPPPLKTPRRRRRLDQMWEVEAERDFEAKQVSQAQATKPAEAEDAQPAAPSASAAGGAEGSGGSAGSSDTAMAVPGVKASAAASNTAETSPRGADAFDGLTQGFLNSSKAKRRGLSDPFLQTAAASAAAMVDAVANGASASAASSSAVRPRSHEELAALMPPVQTERGDRQALLLPAAAESWTPEALAELLGGPVAAAAAAAAAAEAASSQEDTGNGRQRQPEASPEGQEPLGSDRLQEADADEGQEEEEEPGGLFSISALADRLFGDGTDGTVGFAAFRPTPLGFEVEDQPTESTKTPSPKASSTVGSGAQVERSEQVTEDGTDSLDGSTPRPTAGIRLLQQRRRARAEGAGTGSPAGSQELKDETDDLVQLWMKQRW